MSFSLLEFSRLRPSLYHLTARSNLSRIRAQKELRSAASLMAEAGETSAVRARRPDSLEVSIGRTRVAVLRDQRPLHVGNIELEGGWTFEDFVASLNARVFFWPGRFDRPIAHGRRHFSRYRDDDTVVLRVSTAAMFAANPNPLFCRFNSGSPRCSGGRQSPRGPSTFVTAEAATFRPSQVVEVTFEDQARLPNDELEVLSPDAFVRR